MSIAKRIKLAEYLWNSTLDRQDEVELDKAQQHKLSQRLEQHHFTIQDPLID